MEWGACLVLLTPSFGQNTKAAPHVCFVEKAITNEISNVLHVCRRNWGNLVLDQSYRPDGWRRQACIARMKVGNTVRGTVKKGDGWRTEVSSWWLLRTDVNRQGCAQTLQRKPSFIWFIFCLPENLQKDFPVSLSSKITFFRTFFTEFFSVSDVKLIVWHFGRYSSKNVSPFRGSFSSKSTYVLITGMVYLLEITSSNEPSFHIILSFKHYHFRLIFAAICLPEGSR